mmetsp:Transcript_13289/g.18224  ORF Transcript_13289/g.18224 Transcript_13289/m.18224 type:complete len:258 (+) Transcript_13289:74-847(+)
MRLTAEVLLRAEHYLNAYNDRELNLRGLKTPMIENLSILQDQFDVIDFSDNEIKKVDNFPHMKRLNALLINNNYVSKIAANLGEYIPSLTALILTNNKIAMLSEVDNLRSLKKIEILSLIDNPVSLKMSYRVYVIHRIPSLKFLDYRKVSRKEREEVAQWANSTAGKAFITSVAQEAASGGPGAASGGVNGVAMTLTDEQKALVRKAIEAATTKEEIDNIERQLKAGNFSFIEKFQVAESPSDGVDVVNNSAIGSRK